MSLRRPFLGAALAGLSALSLASAGIAFQRASTERWVTGWSTSQNGLGTTAMTNASVRLIARVTIPGDAVRIRLDNTYGPGPVTIGKAYVGQRVQKEILAPGSNRQVLFNGAAEVTIPAGGRITSDPVLLNVMARDDLAVSLHVAGTNVRPSQHGGAMVTSYLSANGTGDVTADQAPPTPGLSAPGKSPFTQTTGATFWLKAIDVRSPASTGAVLAIGDSITDGTCSTQDGWDRWTDWLSVRLALANAQKAVLNEGIGGNTITREGLRPPPNSDPALERLDRDVFSHSGVTHVVLFEGTNDIRRGAPAEQVISGIREIMTRVRARGMKVIGVTIVPRPDAAPSGDNTGWDAAKTAIRHQVNEWILRKAGFDAVLDFDKIVRDPSNQDVYFPSFHCDGIHPSPRGYYELGRSIPIGLFRK